MRQSLEKMLAKGVDNPLLRFGLGKAWLDEGDGAQAAVHLLAVSSRTPPIRQPGSCWARPTSYWGTCQRRARPGKMASRRRRPMATSRPRKK